MKRNVAAGLAVLCLASGAWAGVKGSGKVREEVRAVGDFEGVEVCCGIDATITLGPKTKVTLEAEDNLLGLIRTEVKGGRLVARLENGTSVSSTKPMKLTVVTARLTSVEASGGGSAVAEASPGPKFEAKASGGASVDVRNLKADRVDASGSGGAKLSFAGTAKDLVLDLSGGVNLKAANLAADNVSIDASGGVQGVVRASAEVKGSVSGGVTLEVKGNPAKRQLETSGGADVEYER